VARAPGIDEVPPVAFEGQRVGVLRVAAHG
jgi:hypothetical protein